MNFKNRSRQLEVTLYKMKRLRGISINLFRPTYNGVNLKTGRTEREYERLTIKKAVILSAQNSRDSKILYDIKDRMIIVDGKDITTDFALTNNMHVEFNNKRYQISEFEELDFGKGFIIIVKHQSSYEPLNVTFRRYGENDITLTDVVSGVL